MLSIKAKIDKKIKISIALCAALSISSITSLSLRKLRNNRAKKIFEKIIFNNPLNTKKVEINRNNIPVNYRNLTDHQLFIQIKNFLLNPLNNIPDYLNVFKIVDFNLIDEGHISNIKVPDNLNIDEIDSITPYIIEFQSRKRKEQVLQFDNLVENLDFNKQNSYKKVQNKYINSISFKFNGHEFEIGPFNNSKLHLKYKNINIATIEENKITINCCLLKNNLEINDTNIYKMIKNISNILSYINKKNDSDNSYDIDVLDMFFEIFNDLESVSFIYDFIKIFLSFEKGDFNLLVKGVYNLAGFFTSLFNSKLDINILKHQILKKIISPKNILMREHSINLTYSSMRDTINQAFDMNFGTNFTNITKYIHDIKMVEGIIEFISDQILRDSDILISCQPLIHFFFSKKCTVPYFNDKNNEEKKYIKNIFNNSLNKLNNIEKVRTSMLSILFDILDFSCKSNIYYIFKKDERFIKIQNLIIQKFNLNSNNVQEIFNSIEDNDKKWNDLINLIYENSKYQNQINKMEIEDTIFELNKHIDQVYSSQDIVLLEYIKKICDSINDFLKLIKNNKDVIRGILKSFLTKKINIIVSKDEIIIGNTFSIKLNLNS